MHSGFNSVFRVILTRADVFAPNPQRFIFRQMNSSPYEFRCNKVWRLTPVTPALWEAGVGGLWICGQPGQPGGSLLQTHKYQQLFTDFFFSFQKIHLLWWSRQILTLRLDKQLLRKTCHLLRKSCFWLTQRRQVTRGYKACGERSGSHRVSGRSTDWETHTLCFQTPAHPPWPCGPQTNALHAVQPRELMGAACWRLRRII